MCIFGELSTDRMAVLRIDFVMKKFTICMLLVIAIVINIYFKFI